MMNDFPSLGPSLPRYVPGVRIAFYADPVDMQEAVMRCVTSPEADDIGRVLTLATIENRAHFRAMQERGARFIEIDTVV